MSVTRSRTTRATVATLAIAGALGLSACQEDSSVDAAPPTSSSTSSATSSASSAPSSESSSETSSESSATTAAPSAPSASSSAPAGGGDAGDTTLTPFGTTLKYGQTAVVRESSTSTTAPSYRLTVTGLEKAPDSIYASENLNKANGVVYMLKYKVTNIGKARGTSFAADDVNSFMLVPKLNPGQKGKKVLGSGSQCDSSDTELAVGQSGDGCEMYQAAGAPITDVVFAPGSRIHVTWRG